MSSFAEPKYFLFDKISLVDDSTSRVFPLYVNKFSLKQCVLKKIGYHNSRASKKSMKFVCGLVESVCDNTRLSWDFRYLKINCNLSVNSSVDIFLRNSQKMLGIWKILFNEAIAMKCQKQSSGSSVNRLFWKFSQNSQGNTSAGVSF